MCGIFVALVAGSMTEELPAVVRLAHFEWSSIQVLVCICIHTCALLGDNRIIIDVGMPKYEIFCHTYFITCKKIIEK